MTDENDKRPDVARDDNKSPRKDSKDNWHNAEETMNEGPAGSPKPTKQSRTS